MTIGERIFSFFYGNGLVSLLRILTGAVFIASGASKIADPSSFADSIALYGVVPQILIPYVAIVLPWVELFSGMLLAAGMRIRAAALCIRSRHSRPSSSSFSACFNSSRSLNVRIFLSGSCKSCEAT